MKGRSTCEYDTNTSDTERTYPRAGTDGAVTDRAERRALRLGVTGHRSLDHEVELRRAVNLAIDHALEGRDAQGDSGGLVVVSALAEGADRLVVHECLRRGATLEAVLPLPMDEYTKDFVTDVSRREFSDLVSVAVVVEVAETMPTREQAYERAGHLMVDRSDAIVAVWDGLPARGRGGTADIVTYAQDRRVPVIRVDSGNGQR
jgi:hypothetical protein